MDNSESLLRTAFADAMEIQDARQRAVFLDRACGKDTALRREIEDLIEAEASAGAFLPEMPGANDSQRAIVEGVGAVAPQVGLVESPATEKPGNVIGHYKLLEKIGEGGCGVVYMAEQQEPIRRAVALKVIKLGMDTKQVIARFEAERQALALMDHPNIAKVLDAGATGSGRPFFVMELFRGIKITHYCDKHKLPTRDRLELLIQVCQAVQHAHQKGIIHRDLKPSNILVTDHDGLPVPKIIDFGIAKATTDQRLTDKTLFTAFEQFVGTPAYMSPEQAKLGGLDIDTRSDIYSLGVLLYELLTGRTPFEAKRLLKSGLDEVRRIIQEEEPVRPSTKLQTMEAEEQTTVAKHRQSDPLKLVHQIRGDLDWIVMKALEKDRNRRYETSNGLAVDLQRHLSNEPVLARPPSHLYRFQKVAQRNKSAFVAAIAIVSALVLGIALSLWEAVRAGQAEQAQVQLRKQAQESERKARQAQADEAKQRQTADQARQQAEANGTRLARALDQAELQSAQDFFTAGDSSKALAYLACLLRRDPANEVAAAQLFSGLILRGFAIRLTPPLRHDGIVLFAQFSPDGQRVVTASGDKTARIWDAQTSLPLTPPLRHDRKVWFACFSPDGRRVATASDDNTARVWDAQTGQPLTPPLKHSSRVWSAQFSPDGERILTASDDTTARIWDSRTGQPLTKPLNHENHVSSAEFSPDGQRVVTASDDGTAMVWDAQTGQPLTAPLKHEGRVWFAQFSPDGQRVVTASDDGTARVWSAQTGQALIAPLKHEAGVLWVQFSPDGQKVVTGSEDKTARVWDAQTGQPLTIPLRHEGKVYVANFGVDGQRLVTASDDGTAHVWDTQTGQPLTEPLRHQGRVRYAQFSPDEQRILTASEDATARIWDAHTGQPGGESLQHGKPVMSAEFSPDGQRLVTASNDRSARIWDAHTGQPVGESFKHEDSVRSARFSPDGQRVVTASIDGTARIWDAQTGQPLTEPLKHNGALRSVQFSPDGQLIVTASEDGTAQVWDTFTGQSWAPPLNHHGIVVAARFSPDGHRVVTASDDNTARIWDARTGQALTEPLKHESKVTSVQFSPDGRWVATAADDKTARIWNAITGEPLIAPLKHEDSVKSVQFSSDGQRVVTASWDRTARIWNVQTGQPLTEPLRHGDRVTSAQFSPDSRRVVTASDDKTARIWDAQTGQPLTEPLRHGARVTSALFSSDGQRVVTGSEDNTARIWELPSGLSPVPSWVIQLAEEIATERVNDDRVLEPVPFAHLPAIRKQVREGTGRDVWTHWAKWFFDDPLTRTISPYSTFTLPEYVQYRIDEGTLAGLQEAVKLAPTNGLALARLARAVLAQASSGNPRQIGEAEWYCARALQFAPGDAETRWTQAEILERGGKLPAALEAMNGALKGGSEPQNPEFWTAQGRMMEEANHLDEAYQSFTKAIELAGSKSVRTKFYLIRGNFLKRQNRLTEAAADISLFRNIPLRDPKVSAQQVDLTFYYNAPLNQAWRPGVEKSDLSSLPNGIQTLAGVIFDVRGLIQVGLESRTGQMYPAQVADIGIGRECRRVHFLHSGIDCSSISKGTQIGSYLVHYDNGKRCEIPIVVGQDVGDWLNQSKEESEGLIVAWEGSNEATKKRNQRMRLFKKTWENPSPEIIIKSIDFLSTYQLSAPFLVAITVE